MGLINRDLPAPPAWPPPRDGEDIHELHRYVRARDPVGHQVHTALAMLYLFLLPLATAPKDVASVILIGYAIIRLPNTWRCYPPLLRDALLWTLIAWAAVHGVSIIWSAAPVEGWTELKAFRVILLPLALWPVLDRIPWLVGSFLLGVLGLNLIQFAQRLELFGFGLEGDDRARGMLHPIQSGAFNLAAMTWHVAFLLRAGWRRLPRSALIFWASAVGLAAATVGLLIAGSRGSWLAAAIVLPALWVTFVARVPEARRRALILLAVGSLGAAATWFGGGGGYVQQRVGNAIEEFRAAQEQGDFTTGVGQRVVMTRWAWRFFLEAPIYGQGAGSFRAESKTTPEFERMAEERPGRAKANKFTPAHPHSAYLHVLATTGILGFLPFAAALLILFVRAARDRRDHPFADASLFVLVGWLIGTNFDSYHLNGHLFGLFAFIVAIALPHRPPVERLTQPSGGRTAL